MPSRCMQKILVVGGCIAVSIVASLLIAYTFRLGIGDEGITSGTTGTCRNGTADASALKILTLNAFLIECVVGVRCQEASEREARVGELTAWFRDRDEDVVLFQEAWSFHDALRDGMAGAGFCHYVRPTMSTSTSSGLAIFSKHPIEGLEFVDWFDAFGIGDGMAPRLSNLEAFVADKGVLYANVNKDGTPVHLFNLHANSDTKDDNHDVRVRQFDMVREFVDSMEIPREELVLIGGDFNEDRDSRMRRCEGGAKSEDREYYNEMLETLSASVVENATNVTFTYDTESNDLLKSLYSGSDCDYYQYTLDYIFYSDVHLVPTNSSSCDVLRPSSSSGGFLSDHFPVTCTFDIGTK